MQLASTIATIMDRLLPWAILVVFSVAGVIVGNIKRMLLLTVEIPNELVTSVIIVYYSLTFTAR